MTEGTRKRQLNAWTERKKRQMREMGSEKEREIARERTKW